MFAVLWFWYPRGRIIYGAVIGLVAGGFLRMSAGWFAIQMWQAWGPDDPPGCAS